jgi:DNA mismatch repair protein MutL
VIERPASIVKELIENSIDAKATKIFVDIGRSGKEFIKVSDNGTGMSREDAGVAFQRHSTSKISVEEDLDNIRTLGFRGEALASIAAIAKVDLKTRDNDSEEGTHLTVSDKVSIQAIGCPVGTSITVEDIFFNTPARKKFLKDDAIELKHISDVLMKYSLAYPYIHFRLTNDSKELLNAPPTDSMLTNLSYIYGSKAAKEMIEVFSSKGEMHIKGYISKPKLTRASKVDQHYFVNGRYVRNETLSSAMNDAFSTMVMVGRYPVSVISIVVDPKTVDVNVHPSKIEVKFAKPNIIYDGLFDAVKSSLGQSNLIPEQLSDAIDTKLSHYSHSGEAKYPINTSDQTTLVVAEKEYAMQRLPHIRIFGVIDKTYLVGDMGGSIVIVDQHAAAERILYEKFMEEIKTGELKSQIMLDAQVLQVKPGMIGVFERCDAMLRKIGYDIDIFGDHEIIVRASPVLLGRVIDTSLLFDIVNEIDGGLNAKLLEALIHQRIATKACRAAIKAGDELTSPQLASLIEGLDKKNIPYNCPHGRPILIRFGRFELEKMFKRIV